ncbi:MAG: NUDIX hydrolase [Proteobacteria bacterium]|jgi:8-oxo-dGTP pyrophosphatase MutT (NUDIX family)|nr:NUDIX hydrolase [Pseudomonadota bacterium]MDA1299648.1 NUDIX hydrolase [Pseudomonadota bacterium]
MSDDGKKQHRNDIYGDIDKPEAESSPAIPAATVVLLKDGESGIEVLMLHRTSKVHFGGMWVFPGGRIDPEDHPEDGDLDQAARNAAARETMEETGLSVQADEFVHFAHWTPPASTPRRYATWFFATALDSDEAIEVDGHEIQDHAWIKPKHALERHSKGEIDLAPPTWVTLHHVSRYDAIPDLLARFDAQPHRIYQTRIGKLSDGTRVAMWTGDAGYDATDASAEGHRHRLIMTEDGFVFENSRDDY